MDTNLTTTNQIPAPVNAFYDRTLLERAVAYFVHTKFGQIRDIPEGNGVVIKFRKYGNLTAQTTPLVEGVTPQPKQLSTTDITATVDFYGDYVELTDKVQLTTPDPILTETAEILGDQAGDSLDQLTRDVLNAGTNVLYASTATQRSEVTAAMEFNFTEAKSATKVLKNNEAKKITQMVDPTQMYGTTSVHPSYIGIAHSNTIHDLKDDSNYTPVKDYSDPSRAMEGEAGTIDEIRLLETNNAKVFEDAGASSVDVYSTIVFGRNAYGLSRIGGNAMTNIIKPLGSGGTADPLNQRGTSGWKASFVAVILNQAFLVRVEHGTSSS